MVAVALWWWTQHGAESDPAADRPASAPSSAPASTPSSPTPAPETTPPFPLAPPDTDPVSGLPLVSVTALPAEASRTLSLIDAGGPFPYDRDGLVFFNREGILPPRDSGYYREYTVPTPGASDRGARRIVAGRSTEFYWTADHYASFVRIAR
ncbi:ribonuclease [Nocardioides sp. MJB4]|uniref:Ribonuclease n=1 Tax=Nocardioides donggukensis TaxID=2774019 RepID=A0A927K3V9_9ACTN|nr:ribonuclease [Nocardioides donggukensis]